MDSRLKVQMAPPLSLLTLAALTGDEHTVWMEDENVERLNLTDRPDLVGITVKVDTAHRAFEIARMYRDQGVAVVLGGIHVSAFPQGCRDHADAIVIGEAELVWPQLLDDLQRGELQPVYEQKQAVAVEHIPQPDWSVIVGKDYLFSNAITLVVDARGDAISVIPPARTCPADTGSRRSTRFCETFGRWERVMSCLSMTTLSVARSGAGTFWMRLSRWG
jgi:radical SAM superfamily enzyme YgiQ (UPF0313 family)